MLRSLAPIIVLALAAGPASAADPTGEWLVEGGFAHIKIDTCGDRLWGIVSWEKNGNVDRNNPDPAKRARPTLGIPILLGMVPAKPNRWDGEIYNTEDGRTYTAHVGLAEDDVLKVEGCVLGFLCGSQRWTRVAPPTPQPPARPGGQPARTGSQRTTGQATRPGQPPAPQAAYGTVDNVCMAVAAATGLPLDQPAPAVNKPAPAGNRPDRRSAR